MTVKNLQLDFLNFIDNSLRATMKTFFDKRFLDDASIVVFQIVSY